ncbi:pectate lyase [Brevundimonas subvibrioides]|uniref:Pectic acid lyase n=1 Tax=Brevundimonas subvibrioides (strain ATCC 15264 / DSM 4735 / LMG 14903 / NBRC 16000 / CB 81) TaxID=633149 RepID=D9QNL0_BRESC|nr:pectate lyase [Brevundimonas subvibrioides]ADL02245.1 Pectic acid lyase [Brevundimonas subvibrioides ATCC 15264]
MLTRRTWLVGASAAPLAGAVGAWSAQHVDRAVVVGAMRRATRFMTDRVATRGGYVWSYLADFSRRWGEMEAWPGMIWTQAPGTPEMGHIFLDAFHATGEALYYDAAERAGDALVAGQHPSGGWNYIIDFHGEASLRRWYETIGRNGWRLEEFQHYYGNATFDDHATVECARFLLRLHLEKGEPRFREAVDRAVGFVLDSQYPVGGWPQRWPKMDDFSHHGRPDYTGYITLNDEVAEENIDFLLLVLQQLRDERVRAPIERAMACFLALQQPQPSPGFALQYTLDLRPAGARTYEPAALSPHTTAAAVDRLMDFYELTGDRAFLTRVPEAIAWLRDVEAPAPAQRNGLTHFRYVEPGSNRFIAVHRRGSNAQNGSYYSDYDMTGQFAEKRIDIARLQQRHDRLAATMPEQAAAASPLSGRGPSLMPRYWVTRAVGGSDLNVTAVRARALEVADLVQTLNADGYWPQELRTTSHPYIGPGPAEPPPGFVDQGQVGDDWDTSPFTQPSGPMGISTGTYINNMSRLVGYLRETQGA